MSDKIIVHDREELIFLLSEAAEFEHTVMCTYLYAMWSLKRRPDEHCTSEQLVAIERWRGLIRQVALEEMLHLALVNNLLASLGAAAHLGRPQFPVPAGRFPSDVIFSLRKFCRESVAHFAFIERPEGIEMQDGAGFDHPSHYERAARADLLTPVPQDYGSQGHLYHGIAQALRELCDRYGEDQVFIGHGDAQVGAAEFGLPGLTEVDGLESAIRALEQIVVQGEGAPADSTDSHYAMFQRIATELDSELAADPSFQPAHPSVTDPVLVLSASLSGGALLNSEASTRVVDLGDALYGLMMRTLAQLYSPSPLPAALRRGLGRASGGLMRELGVVAELAAGMPSGIVNGPNAGSNAGLTLSQSASGGLLVQSAAARVLSERTWEIADKAEKLGRELDSTALTELAGRLSDLRVRLLSLHERFETHISSRVDDMASATVQASTPQESEAPASTRDASDSEDPNVAVTDDMTLRFDGKRCIHSRRCVLAQPDVYLANVVGPWLHPEATTVEAVVRTAHACPSGAITYDRRDGGPPEAAPKVNVLRVRENGPYGVHADVALEGHGGVYRATLCRCGKSKNKPFCDNTHRDVGFVATGEPETLPSEPLASRDGKLEIEPLHNGPLLVSGNLEICAGTGRTVARPRTCRLCRCGGSSSKPFCDNTHLRNGFQSDV